MSEHTVVIKSCGLVTSSLELLLKLVDRLFNQILSQYERQKKYH